MSEILFILGLSLGVVIIYQYCKNYYESKNYYFEEPEDSKGVEYISQRFIFPVYPKYLIDQWKYHLWFFTFLTFNYMLYAIVVYVLVQTGPNLELLTDLSQVQQLICSASPTIFGALIITGLLPTLPEQIDFQRWFRNFSQSHANIPNYARNYYKNIKRNGLKISSDKKANTVDFIADASLHVSDFEFRDNSPEKIWAYTCYIYYRIEKFTENANSSYSKNISKSELAFDNFKSNFETVRERLLADEYRDFSEFTKSLINALFSQACQIIVCLIFCSETNDRSAINKFKDIGVNVVQRDDYTIRFDLLVPLSFLIFIAAFIFSFVIGLILPIFGITVPTIKGAWAHRASVAAILILYIPILITHSAKILFKNKWPVRARFDKVDIGPPGMLFILGLIWGIVSFFILDLIFPEMLTNGVMNSLPFASLSGVTSMIIAILIDKSPIKWNLGRVMAFSIVFGIITANIFALLAVLAILMGDPGISLSLISTLQFWKDHVYVISLTASMGFVLGLVNYFITDYSKSIESSISLLDINLNHYIVPIVSRIDGDYQQTNISDQIKRKKKAMWAKLEKYLFEKEIINENGFLTVKGLSRIEELKGNYV